MANQTSIVPMLVIINHVFFVDSLNIKKTMYEKTYLHFKKTDNCHDTNSKLQNKQINK